MLDPPRDIENDPELQQEVLPADETPRANSLGYPVRGVLAKRRLLIHEGVDILYWRWACGKGLGKVGRFIPMSPE